LLAKAEGARGLSYRAVSNLSPVVGRVMASSDIRLMHSATVVQLLVERVDVGTDGLDIHLRTEGVTQTFRELAGVTSSRRLAA
jgi:hypothetical protein